MSAIGDYIHWSIQGYADQVERSKHPNIRDLGNDIRIAHQMIQNITAKRAEEKVLDDIAEKLTVFFNQSSETFADKDFRKEYTKMIEEELNKLTKNVAADFVNLTIDDSGAVISKKREYQVKDLDIETLNKYISILKKYQKSYETRYKTISENLKNKKVKLKELTDFQKNIYTTYNEVEKMLEDLGELKNISAFNRRTKAATNKESVVALVNRAVEACYKNYAGTTSTAIEHVLGKLFFSNDKNNLTNKMTEANLNVALGELFGGIIKDFSGDKRSSTGYNERLIYGKASNLELTRLVGNEWRYVTAAEAKKRTTKYNENNEIIKQGVDYAFSVLDKDLKELPISVSHFGTSPEKVDISFEIESPEIDNSNPFKVGISLKAYESKSSVSIVKGSPLLFMLQSVATIDNKIIPFINHYINLFTIKRNTNVGEFTTIMRGWPIAKEVDKLIQRLLVWTGLTGQGTLRYEMKENQGFLKVEDFPNIFAYLDKKTGQFKAVSMYSIARGVILQDLYRIPALPPKGTFFDKTSDLMDKFLNWPDDPYAQGVLTNQRISHILARLHDIKIHITADLSKL